MHHFSYRDGTLHAEDVPLSEIAARVGTPFYCYSTATLERHYRVFADAFTGRDTIICFSIKANSNLSVIKTLAQQGAGMDVVSEGELRRALAVGVPPARVVFSGVGKTGAEMACALDAGIHSFNIESEAEARALSQVAAERGVSARIAFRINPDVDARTHAKISTGKAEDKFGVPWNAAGALYALAADLPGLDPRGVHMHIGSQITDLEPFERAFTLASDLVGELRAAGHVMEFINLGGGLGVPYRGDNDVPPHPRDYARTIERAAGDLHCRLIFEPGRMIAGNAGILVFRVLYLKHGDIKRFTIVDAGMNDLIRPTLYDAHHDIWAVEEAREEEPSVVQDVVGPVCETGDFLARDRALPPFREGDLGAVMTAGAYGAVQASTYNSRLLVPEVLVSGSEYAVVRPRPSYDEMLGAEDIAPWLRPREVTGRA
jgi:diaminopimelate decarboxylase